MNSSEVRKARLEYLPTYKALLSDANARPTGLGVWSAIQLVVLFFLTIGSQNAAAVVLVFVIGCLMQIIRHLDRLFAIQYAQSQAPHIIIPEADAVHQREESPSPARRPAPCISDETLQDVLARTEK